MFRHVVMFRWKSTADDAAKDAVAVALAGLPAQIDTIRSYRFGPDAHISDGNWDFAVVADFDDRADYLSYAHDPVHQQVIAEVISPIVDRRAAVQFALDS